MGVSLRKYNFIRGNGLYLYLRYLVADVLPSFDCDHNIATSSRDLRPTSSTTALFDSCWKEKSIRKKLAVFNGMCVHCNNYSPQAKWWYESGLLQTSPVTSSNFPPGLQAPWAAATRAESVMILSIFGTSRNLRPPLNQNGRGMNKLLGVKCKVYDFCLLLTITRRRWWWRTPSKIWLFYLISVTFLFTRPLRSQRCNSSSAKELQRRWHCNLPP